MSMAFGQVSLITIFHICRGQVSHYIGDGTGDRGEENTGGDAFFGGVEAWAGLCGRPQVGEGLAWIPRQTQTL